MSAFDCSKGDNKEDPRMTGLPTTHRFTSSEVGALVNAYLVETDNGVVAVDSMLTISDSTMLRAELERLGKPLLAVLLTQSHPDHYGGLPQLVGNDDVPIMAPRGVHDVIRRDDPVKEQILRPMFGDDWAKERIFPNTVVGDRETVTLDGVGFTVIDLGPSESPHDSPWFLAADERVVFLGDQMYGRKHCYLADGFHAEWLSNIERLRRRFPADATFYVGHGGPLGSGDWDWQREYIETFVGAVERADWASPNTAHDAVVAAMKEYLPSEELAFLMELSVEPVAAKLGLLPAAAA
jgi:glyoxylase-like metal-dependent hydrolase (beta-lactamase superfamily II)